jgi:RNA polymerase sigma-70 factor (ECF subfamily)
MSTALLRVLWPGDSALASRSTVDSYRRYGPALLRKARRLLCNEDDARDAVQALFLELLAQEQTPGDLPLLYRMLTHRCLNLLRDRKNRARLLERETPGLGGTARIAPDTMALGLDTLLKLSTRVDEATLETVIYRFVDELGQEEIASLMGVSRKTVQNRLARLEATLRALTEEGVVP